jgi:hypothetical protein
MRQRERITNASKLLLNWRAKLMLTWRALNHKLPTLTEEEVLGLLEDEKTIHRRVVVLERLHQRYSTLRTNRERIELLKIGRKP